MRAPAFEVRMTHESKACIKGFGGGGKERIAIIIIRDNVFYHE
jgi:hypothetical protein